ncbi:MAG: FtsW/RodA/SpoVE family cell cycle protein, partial [Clostridia bacterium]|nr:FtsW/RodA/SpoVE family cell cycle protein [Clostridia bacterium]
MSDKKYKFVADKTLFICVMALSLFGLVMQYSAGSYGAQLETGDAMFYVKKQAVALAVAIAVYLIATMVDTKYYDKFRYVILGIAVVMLALVFIPGVGVENYGATRWINLGFTTFQPSDFAKFSLVIFIASCFCRKSAVTF